MTSQRKTQSSASISEINQQVGSDHWCHLDKPRGTVWVGSSIIRDIFDKKIIATKCICRHGGIINDLQEALDDLPIDMPLSRIFLIGRGV